jgi:hypothetical protein
MIGHGAGEVVTGAKAVGLISKEGMKQGNILLGTAGGIGGGSDLASLARRVIKRKK